MLTVEFSVTTASLPARSTCSAYGGTPPDHEAAAARAARDAFAARAAARAWCNWAVGDAVRAHCLCHCRSSAQRPGEVWAKREAIVGGGRGSGARSEAPGREAGSEGGSEGAAAEAATVAVAALASAWLAVDEVTATTSASAAACWRRFFSPCTLCSLAISDSTATRFIERPARARPMGGSTVAEALVGGASSATGSAPPAVGPGDGDVEAAAAAAAGARA